jgi:hypothetical protein
VANDSTKARKPMTKTARWRREGRQLAVAVTEALEAPFEARWNRTRDCASAASPVEPCVCLRSG